jgi:hypothetical protein
MHSKELEGKENGKPVTLFKVDFMGRLDCLVLPVGMNLVHPRSIHTRFSEAVVHKHEQ